MSDPSASSSRSNRTIYVGGLSPSYTEEHLVSAFSTFGDIVDVQMPREGGRRRGGGNGEEDGGSSGAVARDGGPTRGFGFLVFSTDREAHDAIDNMHLNEIEAGRILNVNLAKPLKTSIGSGNRPVWEDEEWIKKYAQPLDGGQAQDEGQTVQAGGEVEDAQT